MAYRPSRRLIISTAVILALIGAFILILPEVVRRVAVNRLQSALTVPVGIGDVDINLFTGRATIESLIIGRDDPRPIVSLPAMAVGFSRSGLLRGQINLQTIVLRNPQLILERLGADSYNILRAVRFPENSEETATGGAAFTMDRVEIHGGEIVFIDNTQDPDYRVTFSSLNLVAGPVSTLPDANVTPTDFTAGFRIADGSIKLAGSTSALKEPFEMELTAEIANVKLQVFGIYLPYGGRLNLEKSLLNGQARYVLAYSDGKTSKHYLNGMLKIGGIGLLTDPGSRPVLQLAGLEARDIHLDLLENKAQIGALAVMEPHLLVKRDSSGFNLQQFLPESETAVAEGPKQNDQKGIQMPLVVKHAEAQAGTIEFVDQTVSPTVKTLLQDVSFLANNMAVLPNFAAEQVAAEAQLGKGSMRVTGAIYDEPLKGQFSVVGERLPFQPYSGYLNQLFSSANSSGDYINAKLELAFAPEKNDEIVTSISGKLEGHDMALEFPDKENPFLRTDSLGVDLRTIRIGSSPRVDIDQIKFLGANLRVFRDEQGKLDVTRLWASNGRRGSEQSQKRDQETGTTVAIRSITVEKSAIEILDRSVSPNYSTTVSQVRGKLSNLLPSAKRAELKLEGILGESANLKLSGWLTPFTKRPHMHLEGTVQSYALPPLNPYATEYVSHRIRQGQITTDVNYTLKGDEIQATAEIVLRDVRVGEKTGDEFSSRIGIPLELAIALLQDIQGVIRLQLAMSGDTGLRLNVGSLIWNAVRNAIVRSITAPFRLVGNILTLGGRIGAIRIDPILFQPGTREIQPKSAEKLADLTKFLKEKPKLELKLNGGASRSEADTIKRKKFWEKIQTVEGKDYEQALINLYRDMGGITEPVTPLDPVAEESLERFVMEHIEVTDAELRALARDRSEIVKEELQYGGVDPERLIVSAKEDLAMGTAVGVEIELVS